MVLTEDHLRELLNACRYGHIVAKRAAAGARGTGVRLFLESRARHYLLALSDFQHALTCLRWSSPRRLSESRSPLRIRASLCRAETPIGQWAQVETVLLSTFRDAFDTDAPALLRSLIQRQLEHGLEALGQWQHLNANA